MERVVRQDVVRHQVRRRGLSALVLLGALPWSAIGWLSARPAFYALSGLFLLAALACLIPARVFAIDAKAGTLRIILRSLSGKVESWSVPLGELRGVRAFSETKDKAELWIDLPDGRSVMAARSFRPAELRRAAEALARDLGVELNARGLL